jgi:hypothetical protein
MITTTGNDIDPRNYRSTKYASAFTEYLSDLAMENMERGSGDVECPTGYFVRLDRRIVFYDSRGFVWHETYGDAFGASQVYDALERYYAEWSRDEWDDGEERGEQEQEQAIHDADMYLSYVVNCESDSCVAYDFDSWTVRNRPTGPIA